MAPVPLAKPPGQSGYTVKWGGPQKIPPPRFSGEILHAGKLHPSLCPCFLFQVPLPTADGGCPAVVPGPAVILQYVPAAVFTLPVSAHFSVSHAIPSFPAATIPSTPPIQTTVSSPPAQHLSRNALAACFPALSASACSRTALSNPKSS